MANGMKIKKQRQQAITELELDIDLLTYYVNKRTYGVQGSLALLRLRAIVAGTVYELKEGKK